MLLLWFLVINMDPIKGSSETQKWHYFYFCTKPIDFFASHLGQTAEMLLCAIHHYGMHCDKVWGQPLALEQDLFVSLSSLAQCYHEIGT